jgi:hypothetical protein
MFSTSGNLDAYVKILEQRRKLENTFLNTDTMNNAIRYLASKQAEQRNIANRQLQIPLEISNTLQKLIEHSESLSAKYSRYHNQLNDLIQAVNPSLNSFFSKNSRDNIYNAGFINDVELQVIDSIKEEYDEEAQQELNEITDVFEKSPEFRDDVKSFMDDSSKAISTDIFMAFSQMIEKYVGLKTSRGIGLFLNLIFVVYGVLIPLHECSESNAKEERQKILIENTKEDIEEEITDAKNETIEYIDATKDELKESNKEVLEKIDNNQEETNKKFEDLEKRIDSKGGKLDNFKKESNENN